MPKACGLLIDIAEMLGWLRCKIPQAKGKCVEWECGRTDGCPAAFVTHRVALWFKCPEDQMESQRCSRALQEKAIHLL
jgi:hypothetical protein